MYTLCNRIPFPAEYAAPNLPSLSSALDILLDLAFRLPPLLASVDLVIRKPGKQQGPAYNEVIQSLTSLKKMLKSWLKSFGHSTGLEYDISGDSTWQETVASLKRIQEKSVYDLACEALCRSCLLLIYQGLVDVYSMRSSEDATRRGMHHTAAVCAEGLYDTTALLAEVAESPVCKVVATRGPLHFLSEWYSHSGDLVGAERCAEMSTSVHANASYLHWGAVLPWSLLPLIKVPR